MPRQDLFASGETIIKSREAINVFDDKASADGTVPEIHLNIHAEDELGFVRIFHPQRLPRGRLALFLPIVAKFSPLRLIVIAVYRCPGAVRVQPDRCV